MQLGFRIAVWNANGVSQKFNEIEIFIKNNYIDIFLLCETHLNSRSHFKISGYDLITANHPDERCHAGAAILIKSTIKYEISEPFIKPFIQAAGIRVKCNNSFYNLYSIYSPPRHRINCLDYENFFNQVGNRFFVAGDFNAKHPWWGSRIINPRGRQLYNCIQKKNFSVLSGGSPTYWPTDPAKIPDLLDFAVYSGIPGNMLDILNNVDLCSDHNALVINFSLSIEIIQKKIKLISPKTDLRSFSYWIERNIDLNISLKSGDELDDAVENFTNIIHEAAFLSTPTTTPANGRTVYVSAEIRQLINYKRRLRKKWQQTRHPADKRNLNTATSLLKKKIAEYKNNEIGKYLQSLDVNATNNDHNLWKATKYIKRPPRRNVPVKDSNDIWYRTDQDKANAFADHLEQTFKPFLFNTNEYPILQFLDSACQMDLPISHITPNEVLSEIKILNKSKSPGFDKIDASVVKSLSKKAIVFLTLIFNSILRLQHFPTQWKCAEIIMIAKPNKPENSINSYRPISLLITFSKLFEKLFVRRLLPILEARNIIPQYQFGFRNRHGTPEQCHRIVSVISDALEKKKYCSAIFLDIQQAFDRVWHSGLLFKLKNLLPAPFYLVLNSYLKNRSFYVKVNNDTSSLRGIQAGVPQGSVLGPILYTIFTSDMPCTNGVTVATYADDTAFISSHISPIEASNLIQHQINEVQAWLMTWNIKVNEQKSTHVTFALRKGDCPNITLNGSIIQKSNSVNYLGICLDKRLTWKDHVKSKRRQVDDKLKKMYWLLGRKSKLSLENKILIYKTILKPVWTYGIQLWGTTSKSNIEIIQRFQSKTLRMMANAPWFVTNHTLHNDLKIPYVLTEIRKFSDRYLQRLSDHVNPLAISLLNDSEEICRLKRYHVLDLPFRNQ